MKLRIFPLLLLAMLLSAQTLLGADKAQYYSDRISIYFHNDLGPVSLTGKQEQARTGIAEFDRLLEKYQIQSIAQRLPAATKNDHDGDIYLNRFYLIRLHKPRKNLKTVLDDFRSTGYVKMVERVAINRVAYTPNDPQYGSQWFLPQISADRAWDLWTDQGEVPGDSTIVVGIVDTGVQWDHPDLINTVWQNLGEDADGDGATIEFVDDQWQLDSGDLNGIDDDNNNYGDDLIGWDPAGVTSGTDPDNDPMGTPGQGSLGAHMHGTHVSGIVAAATDNNTGIASVGFNIRHMPVKCTYDEDQEDYVSSGYDGITYAAKAGADIVNLSWGGFGSSGFAQSVINNAHNNYGVIIVAAAGNEATTQTHYPSGYDNVISVTATGAGDAFNGWATRGETVDLSAPGENIRSTVYTMYGSYQSWDGTSTASPVAAGATGLFWAMFPDSSQAFIESQIVSTSDNIDDINPDYAGQIGQGRVNVYKAIASRWLPSLSYFNHAIIVLNDDDGQLNPGESAKLRVVLQNENGWATATDVTAHLTSSNPVVTISDADATYNDISGGNSEVNILDTFQFTVDADAEIGTVPFEITVTGGTEPYQFEFTFSFEVEVGLFQAGFPVVTGTNIQTSPLLYDIDDDGAAEIIAGSDDYNLYVLNPDGTMKDGFPFTAQNQIRGSAAVGDADNDGITEIVIASKDNFIYILNPDGTLQGKFQAGGYLMSTPALVDMDGNGDLEIVMNSFDSNVYVINHDSTNFGNFPVSLGEPLMTAPAIADIDQDGELDIVVGTWANNLYALNLDGSVKDGFPFSADDRFDSDPALFDMEGDGMLEIAIGSDDNHLYVLDHAGDVLINYTANNYVRSTPNFQDVDSDGILEIFFGTISQRMYGIDSAGEGLAGFPIDVNGGIYGSPVFADLDNDDEPEILFGTTGGSVEVVHLDGSRYGYFPLNVQSSINTAMTVGYADDDSDLEIVYGTTSSIGAIDVKTEGTTSNYNSVYRGNPQRTGYYTKGRTTVGTTPERSLPTRITLSDNYPNPFNPVTTINYTVPTKSPVALRVFSTTGEEVVTLVNGEKSAGLYNISWNGLDQSGRQVASGVYFYRLVVADRILVKKMVFLR